MEGVELSIVERTTSPEKEEQIFMYLQRVQSHLKWFEERCQLPYANDASIGLGRLIRQIDTLMDSLSDPDFQPEQVVRIAE